MDEIYQPVKTALLTIYIEKLEILGGKSNGSCRFVW